MDWFLSKKCAARESRTFLLKCSICKVVRKQLHAKMYSIEEK